MKNVAKRIASMILCAAMLIGCANFSWSASSDEPSVSAVSETADAKTVGQIIVENYEFFNAKELAIISCTALIGGGCEINRPSDDDGLLSVDAANKTVTAAEKEDNGLVWKPVSAKVIYKNDDGAEAKPIVFSLVGGKGSYDCPADRYTIEVEYQLDAVIDESVQEALINAPADLVQGVINLNELDKYVRMGLRNIKDSIDELFSLTSELDENSEDAKVIVELYNEVKENKNFKLYTLLNNYRSASNKVEYLLKHGEEIKAENERICKDFTVISCENSEVRKLIAACTGAELDNELKTKLELAEEGVDYMADIAEIMTAVVGDEWRVLSHEIVKSDATSAEMDALNTAVNDGITKSINSAVNYYEAPEIKNPLTVATASVSKGVDQYKVNVTISAQVVDKTSVDTNDTITLPEKKTQSFVLVKGATEEEIRSEIENSGVLSSAIELWDPYYNIGNENYDIVWSDLPDSLDADTKCTVTYIPNEYRITYDYDNASEQTVKYGYNLRLPKNSDVAKSYIYTVNGSRQREDTVQHITGDTTISRDEGEATDKYRIPVTIANSVKPADKLSAQEKALLSSLALKEDYVWYRVPSQSENLVEVECTESGEYVVTASDYASGLLSGTPWKPVKVYAYDKDDKIISEAVMEDGTAVFDSSDAIVGLKVAYEVEVTDIDADEVNAWLGLPGELVSEAAAHRAEISKKFMSNDELYYRLALIYGSRLSLIEAVSGGFSDEAKAAMQTLMDETVDYSAVGEPLYLYEYLTEYFYNGGLAYLYEDRVAENINRQVKLLSENLKIICEDDAFQELINTPGVSEYADLFYAVVGGLESVNEITVNDHIDRTSDYLGSLVSAIDAAKGHTSVHTADKVVLGTEITVATPDRTNVIINVKAVNGKGESVGAVATANRSYVTGETYTAENIAELEALLASLESTVKFPVSKDYYIRSAEKALPEVGDVITGETVQYNFVWSPKQYSVVIDGMSDEYSFYADAALAVTLPACGQEGCIYRYRIGNATVTEVGSVPVKYTFSSLKTVEALAVNGVITVECELVNINCENAINLVSELNEALYNNGLVFTKDGEQCLIASFIPLKDPSTGDIAVVLRVSPQYTEAEIQSALSNAASALTKTSLKYIGINNNAFWDGKVHLQSLVNMVLASDFGLDRICDLIDENGDIKEMTELASLEMIDADVYSYIAEPSVLGGKLISAELQAGASADDAVNIPFYITIEDFDLSADTLLKLDSSINKLKNYIDVRCEDGALAVDVSVPESLYPYYIAAMTLSEKADIADLSAMDIGDQMEYALDLVRDLIANDDLTAETLERTLSKLGREIDLGSYSKLFDYARKVANYLIDNAQIEGSSDGATYNGSAFVKIRDALKNGLGVDGMLLSFISEAGKDSGLSAKFSVTLKNMEEKYDALVLDYKASGLKKISLTKDLTSVLANANKNTVVVLLSDTTLTSDVTVGNRVIIDLNGYNLTGNLSSTLSGGSDSVFIVDTKIGTYNCGTVDGTLTGKFTVTGGKFTSDVSAMLKDGYVQKDGYVINSLYTSREEGDDITIEVSLDFLTTHEIPDIKALALDIALDGVVNMYTGATMSVEGNDIYNANVDDVFSLLSMSGSDILNMGLDWFDYDGITTFANEVLSDLTDFEALSEAVLNNSVLASYTASLGKWDLSLSLEGTETDNYIKPSIISSSEEGRSRKINIKLASDTSESDRNKFADLLAHFGDIVKINELSVDLNGISYNDSLSVDGKLTADISLDLSMDKDYAMIVATALANVADGDYKAGLVSAIEEYLNTGKTAALKSAVEEATAAQLISAVKAFGAKSFENMLSDIGVESENAVSLEAVYADVLKIGAAVIAKADITASARKLSTFSKEYGIYSASRTNWHKCDIALEVKLFTEDKAITIKDVAGKVVYETDSLDDAIVNANEGDTIYVNDDVELEKNVTLASDVEINVVEGAEISSVDGSRITLENNVTLTSNIRLTDILTEAVGEYELIEMQIGDKYAYTMGVDLFLNTDISFTIGNTMTLNLFVEDSVDGNAYTAEHCTAYVDALIDGEWLELGYADVKPDDTMVSDGTAEMKFSVGGIPMAYLSNDMRIRFFAYGSEKTYHLELTELSEGISLSFVTYTEKIKQMPEYKDNASLISLLNTMLNYTAAVQEYKKYNTDNLANAGLSDEEKIVPSIVGMDFSEYSNALKRGASSSATATVRFNGSQLLMNSDKTGFRFYFTLDEGVDVSSLELQVKYNGKTATIPASEFKLDANNRYSAVFEGLDPTEFDVQLTAAIFSGSTRVSNVAYDSIPATAKTVSEDDRYADMRDIYAGMLAYCKAAKAYQGSVKS